MSTALLNLLLAANALLVAWAADSSSSSAVPTLNYIDTISGYEELSTCAENVLSTIVRAQYSGCGDHGALTSYTCFCTDSSSLFSYEITSAISVSCATSVWSAQALSAIQVFDAYCDLGVEAGLVSTTATAGTAATGAATPAATASSASTASATASVTTSMASSAAASSTGESTSSNWSRTTAIAAGVAVPVGIIGLFLIGCLLWRRRQNIQRGDREDKQRRLESVPQQTLTGWPRSEYSYASEYQQQIQISQYQNQQHVPQYSAELSNQQQSKMGFGYPQELPGDIPQIVELDESPNSSLAPKDIMSNT